MILDSEEIQALVVLIVCYKRQCSLKGSVVIEILGTIWISQANIHNLEMLSIN